MTANSPPLRFLMLVIAGWAGGRATVLAGWWEGSEAEETAKVEQAAGARSSRAKAPLSDAERSWGGGTDLMPVFAPGPVRTLEIRPSAALGTHGYVRRPTTVAGLTPAPPRRAPSSPNPRESWSLQPFASPSQAALPPSRSGPTPSPNVLPTRWSFSTWAFLRRGEEAALASGGLLGGSQAGARATYRLAGTGRPLRLSLRASIPVERRAGAEAAAGIDWRPARFLPVNLLVERRQALGSEARSAFAVTAYGGVSDAPVGPLRIDAYGQAGMVGTRSHDLFGDGAVRLSLPLDGDGRLKLGAGAWAAAQPGLSRVDIGPQASFRLPLAGRSVTVALDWRRRIAGDARPGSGPALTLATDF